MRSDIESRQLAWHYTVGVKLNSILADGLLRTTDVLIEQGERPALWFSLNQDWEPTANKLCLTPTGELMPLDRDGTERVGHGLFRFGVDPAVTPLMTWRDFTRKRGITSKVVEALEAVGRDQGSDPDDYLVSFVPVGRYQWVTLEVCYRGEWCPVDIEELEPA